jgi:hypothetical protein
MEEEKGQTIGEMIAERQKRFAAADDLLLQAYLEGYSAERVQLAAELAMVERCIAMVREEQHRQE